MKRLIVLCIRLYQLLISPMFPARCRFIPSCSEYCLQAVMRFGVWRGCMLGMRRLLKCGPWHPGGFDPVPDKSM
ncbi:MAG: membrane protein insertion efficiency factor YidD [Alicyclobacillus sp.]|nr:membrane protein insertion efficiency factor YidD [Alicyclobacillus sp.]